MRNKINKLPLLISTIVLMTASNDTYSMGTSINECDKQELNDVAYSRCLDSVKESVDRELQTWINNQVFVLEELAMKTGRHSALKMFKRSQRDFIKFRENNCRWQYLAVSPHPDASKAYKKCYIETSNARIKELSKLSQ